MDLQGFCGGAYEARAPGQNVQTCVNLFVEGGREPASALVNPNKERSKADMVLLGTPGLTRFCSLPGNGVRGLWTATNGRCFAVAGDRFYELFAGGAYLERGTLSSSTGVVSMADNGLQLLLVDGTTQGWVWTFATNVLTTITDDAFYGGTRVAFFDGYFVLNRPGTQQLYSSASYNGLAYDGLDFASDESSPDPLVIFDVERREMLALSTRSGQLWFNAGNLAFPFAPIGGTPLAYGCAAPHSLQSVNTFYWLGTDEHGARLVFRLEGYQAKRCSTHAIEFAMNQYTTVADAIGYIYEEEGHTFYALSFPTGNATWVYDISTELWHERADVDPDTGLFQGHRVQHHAYAFGVHLVGGERDGRIYTQGLDVYRNDTDPLVRERTAPWLHDNRRLIYHHTFELDMETGVGLDGGAVPGTNPQVMLQWSDDGGRTFSTEHWASAGAQGQYLTRVVWRRLGRARQRAYRVRISDPVKVALLAARIEVQ